MRWSRFLKGTALVAVAAAVIAVPLGSAIADVHGTFSVSPTSVAASSSTPFTLTFVPSNASSGGDASACLVYTLTDFTGLSVTSFSVDSKSWSTSVSGSVVTATANSDANNMDNGDTATLHVTATAPSSTGTRSWKLVSYTNPPDCNHPNSSDFSANVAVGPATGAPAKNNTTTVLSCATTTPTVGVADSCTATVRDLGGGSFAISHPTGTVGLSTSGGGSFASGSCTLVALASPNTDSSNCAVNYTATSTGGQSLFAVYGGDTQHNTSNNGTGLAITAGPAASPAPPAGPGRFQPDELIRRLRTTSFLGDNTYNGTGNHQTTRFVARHGQSRTSVVEIQNDGNQVDTLIVTGQGHRPGFTVRYFAGLRNITNDVVSRVYTLNNMAPGATARIRVVITVTRRARPGLVRSWQIEARSTKDPTKRDVVKMKVGVARH